MFFCENNYMTKISVIVAICNIGEYVAECLESLANQTFDGYEILAVVVGVSKDNSLAITEEYQEAYPNLIKILHLPVGTVGDVRNFGMKHSVSEYVLFVDGDDYVEHTMLERLYEKAQLAKADVVVSKIGLLDDQTGKKTIAPANVNLFPSTVMQNPNVLNPSKVEAWNKLIKRDIIADNNLFFPEGRWFEDLSRMYSILLCASKIEIVNEPLYWYRRNRIGSVTQRTDLTGFHAIDSSKDLVSFFQSQNAFSHCYDVLSVHCRKYLMNRLPSLTHSANDYKLYLKQSFAHLDEAFPDWRDQLRPHYSADPISLAKSNTRFARLFPLMPEGLKKNWHKLASNENFQCTVSRLLGAQTETINEKFSMAADVNQVRIGTIFFESQNAVGVCGNLARIFNSIRIDVQPSLNYIWAVDSEGTKIALEEIYSKADNVSFVLKDSDEYLIAMATANYLFFDTCMPVFFRKKKQQNVACVVDSDYLKEIIEMDSFAVFQRGELTRAAMLSDVLVIDELAQDDIVLKDVYGDHLLSKKSVYKFCYASSAVAPDLDQVTFLEKYFSESRVDGCTITLRAPNWIGEWRKYAWGGLDQFEIKDPLQSDKRKLKECVLPHPAAYRYIDPRDKTNNSVLPAFLDEYTVILQADAFWTDRPSLKANVTNMAPKKCFAKEEKACLLDKVFNRGEYLPIRPTVEKRPHIAVYAGRINANQCERVNLLKVLDLLCALPLDVSLLVTNRVSAAGKEILQTLHGRVEILYDEQKPHIFGLGKRTWSRLNRTANLPSKKGQDCITESFKIEYLRRFGDVNFSHYIDLAGDNNDLLAVFLSQPNIDTTVFSPYNLPKRISSEKKKHKENNFVAQSCSAWMKLAELSDNKFDFDANRCDLIFDIVISGNKNG